MELDIAPPPCSGAEMVSSTSSRRTRLDAATTSRLLSAVTLANSNIMGLGISFDLEPSSTISTKSFNDRSTRNSRIKEQTPEASLKMSVSAVASHQNNRTKVSIAAASANGPPRWPSDVPGLGNTILGPRRPYISNSSCPRNITRHNSPTLSTHVTSPIISHLAPASSKSSRASRTSTKRRASSPPSTGLSAKMARVSVDSIPVNSVPASSPAVKHDQTDEQCMAPRRCGSRRLGLSEGEKRAKAAKLCKECSVQEGPQLLNPGMLLGSRAEVFALSPKVQVGIEYACDTIDDAPQLSVDHEGSYKVRKHPERPIQSSRSERRIAKLDQAASYKQISQASAPFHITNTRFRGHTLPSAIKKSAATSMSSNEKKRVSFADQTNLDHLVHQLLALLDPYTHLHSSCPVRPLRLIHASLSSSSPTTAVLVTALKDAQELLKVLSEHQIAPPEKLEAMKEELERVGMGSVAFEARERVEKTEDDVKRLGEWMGECKA